MPYRPAERQYRNFAVGSFQPEVRESSDDQKQSYQVRGYFCTFRQPYLLFDDYYEEIDPSAFDECDMSDVVVQLNHSGFVYARNRNGSLKIDVDDHGGHCVADLSGSKQGREDLYEAITNGLIDTMSFGFTIADDGWEWDEDDDGVIHTRITKISKLYDVSPIAGFAANPNTEISARSLYDAVMESKSKKADLKSDEPETRSAESEDITDGTLIVGEAVEFEPDVESIAQRVAEILDIQYRKDDPRDDDPDDDPDDDTDNDPDDDDDDVKERAIVDETFKRRQRRMRAMRLATI